MPRSVEIAAGAFEFIVYIFSVIKPEAATDANCFSRRTIRQNRVSVQARHHRLPPCSSTPLPGHENPVFTVGRRLRQSGLAEGRIAR